MLFGISELFFGINAAWWNRRSEHIGLVTAAYSYPSMTEGEMIVVGSKTYAPLLLLSGSGGRIDAAEPRYCPADIDSRVLGTTEDT